MTKPEPSADVCCDPSPLAAVELLVELTRTTREPWAAHSRCLGHHRRTGVETAEESNRSDRNDAAENRGRDEGGDRTERGERHDSTFIALPR